MTERPAMDATRARLAADVAFHLFAAVPADLLVLEVGLGGRLDATNVVDRPAACAITAIGMDHMDFLGDTLGKIAAEKAGIIKPGLPCAIKAAEFLSAYLACPALLGGGECVGRLVHQRLRVQRSGVVDRKANCGLGSLKKCCVLLVIHRRPPAKEGGALAPSSAVL